jgi:MFS family permease
LKRIFQIYRAAYSDLPVGAWILSLVVFINRSGSIVLFFMTLYLTRELDFTVAAAGRMLSIYGFGALLGTYLGGWLSDIIGTKRVQLYSLILSGLGFIILGTLVKPLPIGVLMFLLAIVSEAFRPANATAISEVCPPLLRPRAFALNRLAINLGVTIGPALGGFLASVNYHYLFWVDGITCFFAGLLLWIFFRNILPSRFESSPQMESTIITPWKDKIYVLILILVFLNAIIFTQLFNTWPIYLRDFYGLLEDKIGLLVMVNAFLIVLFEMPVIHKLEKSEHLRIIAIGSLLLSAGFALLPLGATFRFAVLTVIIWTIGEIMVFPLLTGFISNRAPERSRGKYLGMYNFSFSLALVIGPLFGTNIYDFVSPVILWLSCGMLGILSYFGFRWVGILVWKEKSHQ